MVEFNGNRIGYIQFYRLDEETKDVYGYRSGELYGMDQFIGEAEYRNKGIGKLLVSSMVDYLMDHHNAERVVMDPQTSNAKAIQCYEKCGFKKIKILSKRELHEGEYRDCWLMEFNK